MINDIILLKPLIEFKFESIDLDEYISLLSEYSVKLTNQTIDEYINGGWREKLLGSLFVSITKKNEYLMVLERALFNEINGRPIKGYVLAIIILCNEDEAYKILKSFVERNLSSSREIDWVNAGISIVNKIDSEDYNKDKINKLAKAVDIIKMAIDKIGDV